ncbi:MAG: hypothetical protein GX811_06795 [Lentisphaerae bacterium]|jgi:hypothetical protein|nr:hypothetical protein [Lentisphaerota bacterium]
MIKLSKYYIVAMLLYANLCFADHPTLNTEKNVNVTFLFPDSTNKSVALTKDDVNQALKEKPLPKDLHIDTYKIDWWIFGALQKLDIPFKAKTEGKTGNWKTTIIKIGDLSNGADGEWIFYVNGIRSKYYVSTQLDSEVKSIKFEYKKQSQQ